MLTSDGGAIVSPFTDGGGVQIYHNFIEADARRADHHVKGLYVDSMGVGDPTADYIYRHNIIVGIAGGMTALMPNSGIQFYNNTVIDADTGFKSGYHSGAEPMAQDMVFKDNLFVGVDNDYSFSIVQDISGEQYGQFADTDGVMPFPNAERDGVISSGNTRGTVNEQFQPTGDTPDVGAILRGEDMFEYGVTWDIDGLPPRNINAHDDIDPNPGTDEPENPEPTNPDSPDTTPQTPDTPQDTAPDVDTTDPLSIWVIVAIAAGAVVVVVIVIVVVKKRR